MSTPRRDSSLAARGSEPVRVVELERRTGATVRAEADRVAVEEPMEVRVNGAPFAVIMRTPGDDMALAAGFLLAEDVVRGGAEIGVIEQCLDVEPEARGNVLSVTVVGEAVDRLVVRLGERRQVTTTSACGLCGRRTIESLRSRAATVDGRWTVPAAVVSRLPLALRAAQRTFDATGGVHAAALTDLEGTVVRVAEDVGRHNAVDKIIGRALLEGALPLDRAMLVAQRPDVLRAGAKGAARRRAAGGGGVGPLESRYRPRPRRRHHPVRLRPWRQPERLRASRASVVVTAVTPGFVAVTVAAGRR